VLLTLGLPLEILHLLRAWQHLTVDLFRYRSINELLYLEE
jgi:hypothetical protein